MRYVLSFLLFILCWFCGLSLLCVMLWAVWVVYTLSFRAPFVVNRQRTPHWVLCTLSFVRDQPEQNSISYIGCAITDPSYDQPPLRTINRLGSFDLVHKTIILLRVSAAFVVRMTVSSRFRVPVYSRLRLLVFAGARVPVFQEVRRFESSVLFADDVSRFAVCGVVFFGRAGRGADHVPVYSGCSSASYSARRCKVCKYRVCRSADADTQILARFDRLWSLVLVL